MGSRSFRLMTAIWITFLISYLHRTIGRTKALPRWHVNSKLLNKLLLSARIVFAFVRTVYKMKSNAFKGHRFNLILVEWWVEVKSTTSTPPFVWSYITRTCCLHRCHQGNDILSPDFFLSIHETSIIFLSWWWTDNVDL